MPTILRVGALRFFFYSGEQTEPPHVHVQRGRSLAKLWLDPVRPAASKRFRAHELRRIERLVVKNEPLFPEAWNDFFGT
ncbi:MAG: DUF4160 domain-containing protein [Planctomycetota bacterium]|jgi:hypothetical protein